MFKVKSLSISLLIVLAVSAFVASTAFAAEAQPKYVLENGKAITTTTQVKGFITGFFIQVKGIKFSVGCRGVAAGATVEGEGKSKLMLEFSACTVFNGDFTEEPSCTVAEPVQIKLTDQLVFKGGKTGEEALDVYYASQSKFKEGKWFTLKVEGKPCEHAGSYSVIGSAIGLLSPNKAGVFQQKQTTAWEGPNSPTGSYFDHDTGATEEAGKLTVETGKEKLGAALAGGLIEELPNDEPFGVT